MVPDPIRIRARVRDDVTEVHVLMPHPMETGFRLDEAGHPVTAHYITDVRITVADRPILGATLSRAVSEDPLLFFRFKGGRAGQTITVAWTDTRGERRVDEAVILAM